MVPQCDGVYLWSVSRFPTRHAVIDRSVEYPLSPSIASFASLFDASPFTKPLEALRAACSEAPDLLVTDVVMPLLSGIELAIQVQERCPDCKVLLFSGQASASINTLSKGHNFELLSKPAHPTDLLKKIQVKLGYAS
jgi:DNA-binding NtrC family response regulator